LTLFLQPLSGKLLNFLLLPKLSSITFHYTGIFPKAFEHGLISLLLKKPGLLKEFLSNYRPIINLAFVSKELECNSRR